MARDTFGSSDDIIKLFMAGHDTQAIAKALQTKEYIVYNRLCKIRENIHEQNGVNFRLASKRKQALENIKSRGDV